MNGTRAPRRIKRRAAVYVGGLDPRSYRFHHGLYRSEFARYIARTGLAGAATDIVPPPRAKPWLHRWSTTIDDGSGPVETTIHYLEWQDLAPIRRRGGLLQRVATGLSVGWDMLRKGVFRKSLWYGFSQFWLAIYPFAFLIFSIAVALAAPLAGLVLGAGFGWVGAGLGLALGVALSVGYYRLTLWLDRLIFCWFLLGFWAYQRMQGTDDPRVVARYDLFADHVLELMADPDLDEVAICAMSTGGFISLNLIGTMLERDPDFAGSGRHLAFLSFGVAPSVPGWFGPTDRFIRALRRVLSSEALTWVNYHIDRDPMSAVDYDPVRDFDLDPGADGFRQPVMEYRRIDLRRMLKPETMRALYGNLFHKHYRYVMASETGEEHDFFALICGPQPVLVAAGAR